MPETLFNLKQVEYCYPGGSVALTGINLNINSGESIALLGANASGKSTLLRLLDGLYFANSGEVRAFGVKLSEPVVENGDFARDFRKRVGYLFQNPDAQLFNTSVEEELWFGPLHMEMLPEDVRQRIDEVAALCQIGHLLKRPPHRLSGGEMKRVALASILAVNPSVLLLDEPTAGLDPRTESWLVETLNLLHQAGKTLVIATHDFHLAIEVADRAIVLSEDHHVVRDGPITEVVADTDLLVSVNLLRTHTHPQGSPPHAHPHEQ